MNDISAIAALDPRIGPTIQLAGGHYFNLLDPWNSEFEIQDVAHGLAHLCRFTGHTRTFYSVAQHSVMVSLILPSELAMAGLFHDAQEAFIGDMSTPLKNLLPGYREIEREVERAVHARFGLPERLPPEVKQADLIMLATEKRDLMPACDMAWHLLEGITPLPARIEPLGPDAARALFMRRYTEISNMDAGPARVQNGKAMEKQEWLDLCTSRLMRRGGLNPEQARHHAEACLENINGDLTESPEDSADEDMSRWGD